MPNRPNSTTTPTELVQISRSKASSGRFGEMDKNILDACDRLREKHGSAANALRQMVIESPLYKKAMRAMRRKPRAAV